MCGISGFIDFSKTCTAENITKMSDTLLHRGPDAGAIYFNAENAYNLGLGHRRLSIIDTSTHANQPMHYNDWVIVFNGEIYNYKALKIKLIALGHEFKTDSDTEVILHAFEQWQNDCVHHFIGMFAFAIFNKRTQDLKIFRDRPGVKPLYYFWDGSLFMFASELKAFHANPGFEKEIDISQVKQYIQYGYIPTPNSIYKRVKKLPPGSLMHFNPFSKEIIIEKYWNVETYYEKPKLKIDFEEAKTETEDILKSACEYRMVADVPVGVFLSGGYDSTLTAAMLQTETSKKINTFTIGVADQDLNEAKFAKETANRLGTNHSEIYCEEHHLFDLIEQIPHFFDEPFGDSSAIPTMLLSKFAKEQVTVALSADGGDEVFGGYNRYDYLKQLQRLRTIKKIPADLGVIMNLLIRDSEKRKRIKKLYKDPSVYQLANLLNSGLHPEEVDRLFLKSSIDSMAMVNNFQNDSIEGDLSKMMQYDYQTYLPDDILTKVDRATMSASLEGREPLLDHRIIEYVATLPDAFKYNNGSKKFILKEIVHKHVPKDLMERPKMGFAIPMKRWLQNELTEKIEYYLNEEFINKQGIFNHKEINTIKSAILLDETKHYQTLWYLLVFQMWYEKWHS